jgi:hypothetical protein
MDMSLTAKGRRRTPAEKAKVMPRQAQMASAHQALERHQDQEVRPECRHLLAAGQRRNPSSPVQQWEHSGAGCLLSTSFPRAAGLDGGTVPGLP